MEVRIGDWQLDAIGLRTDLKGQTLELESSTWHVPSLAFRASARSTLAVALAASAQDDGEELQFASDPLMLRRRQRT